MKNILLVDDSFLFLEVMQDYIMQNRKGVNCIKFYDSRNVIQYLAEGHSADVIIADYHIPGMNGIELASNVLHSYSQIKMILCSDMEVDYLKKCMIKFNISEQFIELLPKAHFQELVKKI